MNSHATRKPAPGPSERAAYVYMPPADGKRLASWPIAVAAQMQAISASATDSGSACREYGHRDVDRVRDRGRRRHVRDRLEQDLRQADRVLAQVVEAGWDAADPASIALPPVLVREAPLAFCVTGRKPAPAIATLGTHDRLLERSDQLATLARRLDDVRETAAAGSCSSPARRASARPRCVRAFCARAGAARVLWGALRRAPHAAAARAVRRHRRAGRRRARGGRRRARPRPATSPRRSLRELAGARRRSSCSRTCTGPTRRRSTSSGCSPGASSRCRRSCSRPTATTSSTAAHPLRIVARRAAARARSSGSRSRRSRRAAVAALAGPHGVDAARAAPPTRPATRSSSPRCSPPASGEVPATVRDAVLARAARLDARRPARCSTPSRSCRRGPSSGCSRRSPATALDALEACLASGMLARRAQRRRASATRSRASRSRRRSPPHRAARAAPRARSRALRPRRRPAPDLARLAHHAEAAGDADGGAALRAGGRRARRRARLAPRGGRAVRARAALRRRAAGRAERADLLERRSYECYLTDAHRRRDRRAPARRWTSTAAAGDRLREGDAHRWLSRLAWFAGDNAARRAPRRGWRSSCSSRSRPGRELAMAYSNLAQLRDARRATSPRRSRWGERAIALAERLGRDRDPRPRAQQRRRGAAPARARGGREPARAQPRPRARRAATRSTSARAYTNLAPMAVEPRDLAARRAAPRRRASPTASSATSTRWRCT